MASRPFWKTIRLIVLLFILFIVGVDAYLTKLRTTDWDQPLRIVIYPINGDGSDAVNEYIDDLSIDVFEPVAQFMAEEAAEYQVGIETPVEMALGPRINEIPPLPPMQRNILQTMWWSL